VADGVPLKRAVPHRCHVASESTTLRAADQLVFKALAPAPVVILPAGHAG
jgi:hypothetical protein